MLKKRQKMNNNKMYFRPDGTFHILQVSDTQDLSTARKAMLIMLDNAYDKLKPDLVLFTGDNTLGNHLLDVLGFLKLRKKENYPLTLSRMKKALANILIPVEKRNIPFAMIFGNHDDMNCISKQVQFNIYKEYSCCLPMNENDTDVDCDTYNIPVCSSDGKTKWNVYMLDSAWNDESGQHCEIKEETVKWYRRTSDSLKNENGSAVPSLMFLHVPLEQTKALYKPCAEDSHDAVADKDGYFCLDTSKASGQMRESISAAADPYGLYEALKEKGNVKAVVSGHDHVNCFDGEADGMRFIQSGAASFRCYGDKIRGVREFILHENDDTFETKYYTYDDICGKGIRQQIRYFWDADDKIPQKYSAIAGVTAAAGALAFILHKKRKKRK